MAKTDVQPEHDERDITPSSGKNDLTAAEREELETLRAQAKAQASGNVNEGNVAAEEPTHVALLANGERFEYSGAHPTHVGFADGPTVPVVGVYPLSI